jgi:hypothetical protein
MWFGESEANVRELFDKARAAGTLTLLILALLRAVLVLLVLLLVQLFTNTTACSICATSVAGSTVASLIV